MSQPRTRHKSTIHFGVDIGGTGIKAAPVDLTSGKLTAERLRIPTPQPATPDAVARVVGEVVKHFGWTGPVGVAFPAAVKAGVAMTAANVDKRWIGTDIEHTLEAATGTRVRAVNDADAAGVAELAYGAGRGQQGVVIMTTFGTGIGTALFLHGQLVPNTELGHLEIDGEDAEKGASELVRERKQLSWAKWAKRVDRYLGHLEDLFWPDLIIIGGGASRKAEKFLPLLTVRTTVVPAALQNDAGIVGAAVVANADVTRPGGGHQLSVASGSGSAAPTAATAVTAAASVPAAAVPAALPAPAAEKAAPSRRRSAAKRVPAGAAPAKAAPAKAAAVKRGPTKQAAITPAPGSSAGPAAPPAG
jgi:polyphosphate glucokinase